MKKEFLTWHFNVNSVFCYIFGHHYSVSRKITAHIKEYKCIHCFKETTIDANGNLSNLTPEMKDINETLQNLYQKRHSKSHKNVA